MNKDRNQDQDEGEEDTRTTARRPLRPCRRVDDGELCVGPHCGTAVEAMHYATRSLAESPALRCTPPVGLGPACTAVQGIPPHCPEARIPHGVPTRRVRWLGEGIQWSGVGRASWLSVGQSWPAGGGPLRNCVPRPLLHFGARRAAEARSAKKLKSLLADYEVRARRVVGSVEMWNDGGALLGTPGLHSAERSHVWAQYNRRTRSKTCLGRISLGGPRGFDRGHY